MILKKKNKKILKNPKKEYEYPGNCAYKFIVDLISEWKKHLVKDKSNKLLEKYYDAFLGVLEGKKLDKKILNDFENIDKDSKPMNDEDLNRVLNAGAISTSLTNDKNKQIEKEMIEKGDYTVNIVIGGKSEDNQFNKQFEKNDNNLKKDKEELNKFFEGALGCLEIIYYQIKNSEKYQYASNVKKEIKKLILEKYEQYLEKFNEKNEESIHKSMEKIDTSKLKVGEKTSEHSIIIQCKKLDKTILNDKKINIIIRNPNLFLIIF